MTKVEQYDVKEDNTSAEDVNTPYVKVWRRCEKWYLKRESDLQPALEQRNRLVADLSILGVVPGSFLDYDDYVWTNVKTKTGTWRLLMINGCLGISFLHSKPITNCNNSIEYLPDCTKKLITRRKSFKRIIQISTVPSSNCQEEFKADESARYTSE